MLLWWILYWFCLLNFLNDIWFISHQWSVCTLLMMIVSNTIMLVPLHLMRNQHWLVSVLWCCLNLDIEIEQLWSISFDIWSVVWEWLYFSFQSVLSSISHVMRCLIALNFLFFESGVLLRSLRSLKCLIAENWRLKIHVLSIFVILFIKSDFFINFSHLRIAIDIFSADISKLLHVFSKIFII